MNHKKNIYIIMTIVFILDQIVKVIVTQSMKLYQQIIIIPHFFSIYYVKNTGAAFSILENNIPILIMIGAVFMVGLNHYIKREEHFTKLSVLSLGLLLGGIFGNLLDRAIRKSVIDYLSFIIIRYDFPVFNIADIAITVGIAIFMLDTFLEKRKEKKNGTLSSN